MILETILITIVLLLPPLVLWGCRSFCEKHPSTVPLRTVPLGCLTMLWLVLLYGTAISWLYHSVLETNPPHWLDAVKELPILVVAIPLGIFVIVILSKRLNKGIEPPPDQPSGILDGPGCLYPAVFIGALLLSLGISCCCSIGHGPFDSEGFDKESRDWYTIFLPKLQDCQIAFEQRPSHPFLAEYDYRIRLRHGKEQAYFQLWPNTGGRTFVNVYKIAEDKLLLKGKDADYIIDSTQKQVYLVRVVFSSPQMSPEIHFAVPLCEKPFGPMGGKDKDLEVNFSDGTTARAIPYEADLQNREYIGCIMDYSFYTPDEQPEGEGHPRYRDKK